MNISTMTTQTQIFLLWTLTSFLLIWMVIFTLLALRSGSKKVTEAIEATERAITTQPLPITSTPPIVHIVTTQPTPLEAISPEPTSDIGAPSLR